MCKTNQQNWTEFWKSYYGPNIGQTTAAKLLCFLYRSKTIERKNLIMPTFIELTLCKQGHKWSAVINLDDIARFSEGPNNLTMRTPFATGDYDVTVVSEDAERLAQALLSHNQER